MFEAFLKRSKIDTTLKNASLKELKQMQGLFKIQFSNIGFVFDTLI
jgi:hypothetical protein